MGTGLLVVGGAVLVLGIGHQRKIEQELAEVGWKTANDIPGISSRRLNLTLDAGRHFLVAAIGGAILGAALGLFENLLMLY